ncbi:N-acetyltransferase family protein [Roseivirga sp. BDSF3-8]|uniref:GNAT family N-acetyltransferase n=1 Tax=Roseivirga sp. BDSF3-8 TaxID=3241598 RepID=UPI003531DF26
MGKVVNIPDYLIRKACTDDIQELNTIYNNIIREGGATGNQQPVSTASFTNWYHSHQEPPYYIFVIEIAGKPVGYFYFSPWRPGREAFAHTSELSFYLSTKHRGYGLGDIMVKQGITFAADAGLKVLLSIVLEENNRSISLLKKHGFKEGGYFPGVAKIGSKISGQFILYYSLEKDFSI